MKSARDLGGQLVCSRHGLDDGMTNWMAKSPGLPRRRSPRPREFDYSASHAYSITICTRERIAYFKDEAAGREVAKCLEEQAEQSGFRLVAYCVMPDHLHILTGPSAHQAALSLPQFVQRFKSASTRRLWKVGISGVVWQRSFHDRVLRNDEGLRGVAEYILGNPMRKGLVQAPETYPLSRSFLGAWPV